MEVVSQHYLVFYLVLINATKRCIYLDDIKLNKLKYKEIAKHIACVHQHNSAPEDIDVETLVSYGRSPYQKKFKGR